MKEMFTEFELKIINDEEFLQAKNNVILKVQDFFEHTRNEIKNTIENNNLTLPLGVDSSIGKIFRGENYKGLPYVVLDYPKLYSKRNIFSFRTMFWWGNFLSITLHIGGDCLEKYRLQIIDHREVLAKDELYICVNDHPWDYHYDENNYVLLNQLSDSKIDNMDFIKLSKKYNVDKFSEFPKLASKFVVIILQSIMPSEN